MCMCVCTHTHTHTNLCTILYAIFYIDSCIRKTKLLGRLVGTTCRYNVFAIFELILQKLSNWVMNFTFTQMLITILFLWYKMEMSYVYIKPQKSYSVCSPWLLSTIWYNIFYVLMYFYFDDTIYRAVKLQYTHNPYILISYYVVLLGTQARFSLNAAARKTSS